MKPAGAALVGELNEGHGGKYRAGAAGVESNR